MKKITQIVGAVVLSAGGLLAGIGISNRISGNGEVPPEPKATEDVFKACPAVGQEGQETQCVYALSNYNPSEENKKRYAERLQKLSKINASTTILANFGGDKPVISDDLSVTTLKDTFDLVSQEALRTGNQYFARAFDTKGDLLAEIRCVDKHCVLQTAKDLKPRR